MANTRVLLSPSPPRLRVSKVGIDATSNFDPDLIFDSGKGNYTGVYQTGTVNYTAFNAGTIYAVGPFTYNDRQAFVNLNKTFASPPNFILAVRDIVYPVAGEYGSTCNMSWANMSFNGSTFSGGRFRVWGYTTTTQMVLNIQFVLATSIPGAPWTDMSFIIFQK